MDTRHRTGRRGANAMEFGLVLPVLLAITLGGMDWGWYFWCGSALGRAAREGARAGATAPADTATAEAVQAAEAIWAESGIQGKPRFSTQIRTVSGVQMFTLSATMPYDPLLGGMVPVPDTVERSSDMHRP